MFNMYTCTVAVPLCVSLGVVYYIAYISRPGSNLFSYHPVSMTVAVSNAAIFFITFFILFLFSVTFLYPFNFKVNWI